MNAAEILQYPQVSSQLLGL